MTSTISDLFASGGLVAPAFKPGDKVVRIGATLDEVTRGNEYTVDRIVSGGIKLVGLRLTYTAHKFELAPTTIRSEVLTTASDLIHGDREKDYGRPIDSFTRLAAAINIVLEGAGHPPVDATTAAKLMIALKFSRLAGGDNKRDTWVDLAGYSALGAEVHEQS